MLRANMDRAKGLVDAAVKAAADGAAPTLAPAVASGGGGPAGGGGSAAQSIQDESGNLYAMWDISTWDGPDVWAL